MLNGFAGILTAAKKPNIFFKDVEPLVSTK
ncbi:MAG: hypothetical protein RLY16_1658 [Bacteroidota bacterium]|jgi:hypothetical protein